MAPLKPLSEVLRENKERKEAEFQGVWKNMKIGEDEDGLLHCASRMKLGAVASSMVIIPDSIRYIFAPHDRQKSSS